MNLPHPNPWDISHWPDLDDGSLDSDLWNSKLSTAVTPWDVASHHLRNGGSWSTAMIDWLIDHECGPLDVGRFARQMEVDPAAFLRSRKDHRYVDELTRGFISEHPVRQPPSRSPDFAGQERAQIAQNDADSGRLACKAWKAIEAANVPEQIFKFGDALSWVEGSTLSPPVVRAISNDQFANYLHHRLIRWVADDSTDPKEVEPPPRVTRDMLADPHPPVPSLAGVRSAPVFGPSGDLAVESGYHRDSSMFVWTGDLNVPLVPKDPSAADIAKARNLIEFELLGDFPFEDEASRANAIAALLHPFVRPMIEGATPIHLIDKPAAGTGAGLLVHALTFPGLGHPPSMTTIGKLEDEIQFKLAALLRTGPIAVVIDNIKRILDSEAIAAMVTADIYESRIIKTSEMAVIPVRCLWLATGNNVQVSHEMARRCVLTRLDAQIEHPEEGRTFRHEDLREWARQNRGDLVWAALVLVQAWVSKGMPRGSKTKASFESWARTISGIFDVCGITGFLDNTDKMKAFSDPEEESWAAFVEAWWERFEGQSVGARDLHYLGQEHFTDLLVGGRGSETAWGQKLKSKKDAVIGDKKIVAAGKKQGAAQWRLAPMPKK